MALSKIAMQKPLLIQIGINIGIILVISAILVLVGFDLKNRVPRIVNLREELNFWSQSTESLASLKADFERSKNYLIELENLLPSRDELFNFSRDLNIIANQNKINLSVDLGKEERDLSSKLGRVNLTLTAEGTFENLIKFLEGLKNSRYSIKTASLDLSGGTKDKLRLSISGQVFSFY